MYYYREVISGFRFGECQLASAVLQAVRLCRWWGVADSERVPPALLGCYYFMILFVVGDLQYYPQLNAAIFFGGGD